MCAIEDGWLRVLGDSNEPLLAPADRFEVVDSTRPPWWLAHAGSVGSGMFLVPGFFERWHDRDSRFRELFALEYERLVALDRDRSDHVK